MSVKTAIARRLTPKQRRFVEELPACGWNATEAAIRAGYSTHTARSIGSENLTKPDIARELIDMEFVEQGTFFEH
jgi:phage terminase small subunit